MKDQIGGAVNHLKERAFSPLAMAFIISWCFWNYELLLMMFSDISAKDKIKYINIVHLSNEQEVWRDNFWYPLLGTIFYLLLWIPKWLYQWANKWCQVQMLEGNRQIEEKYSSKNLREDREFLSNISSYMFVIFITRAALKALLVALEYKTSKLALSYPTGKFTIKNGTDLIFNAENSGIRSVDILHGFGRLKELGLIEWEDLSNSKGTLTFTSSGKSRAFSDFYRL